MFAATVYSQRSDRHITLEDHANYARAQATERAQHEQRIQKVAEDHRRALMQAGVQHINDEQAVAYARRKTKIADDRSNEVKANIAFSTALGGLGALAGTMICPGVGTVIGGSVGAAFGRLLIATV